jgi:hypothetical protein
MKVSFPEREDAPGTGPGGRKLAKVALAAAAGFLLLMFVFVLTQPETLLRAYTAVEARWGATTLGSNRGFAEKWSVVIGGFFRSQIVTLPDIPELVIDVPFKDMRRIYEKRAQALRAGHLVQGPDDFVKGDIRIGDRTVPVRLRLKGDWTDHLEGRKWSFRIRVRQGDHLLGMRRFSIQSPATRGYHAEAMYFELLKGFGIMTPRYEFVDVTLNGEPVGIMALEEFFAKELLEFNRRRDGVIVRFDESLPWDARDSLTHEPVGWNGAFDDYRNTAIDGIGSTTIAESPALAEQYRIASGLLRGFADGTLQASEVFDVEQLGRFIATTDALGAWHATRWANLRFYLNPVTTRLEPIPFDATLQGAYRDARSIVSGEPIVLDMLADPAVWEVYIRTLSLLRDFARDGKLQQNLAAVEAQWLPVLRTEFRMLGSFELDYLLPRIDTLYEQMSRVSPGDELAINRPFETRLYPVLAHFKLVQDDDGLKLEVENAVPMDVVVTGVEWVNGASGERQAAVTEGLPLAIPPRGIGSRGVRAKLALTAAPAPEGWILETTSTLSGRSWVSRSRPSLAINALPASPIPATSTEAALSTHEFLELVGTELRVGTGNWQVDTNLVIPAGHALRIAPGASLEFAPDAALVAHGPVIFEGTAAAPIILAPQRASWPGMVVLNAAARSALQHVQVSSTHSVSMSGWTLTGGVNFYASDVDIADVRFIDSQGEDALNIIHSDFEIRGTSFSGTASDAFDADFSNGTIRDSHFADIGSAGGGDAIDVSGTQLVVEDVSFTNVSDKALSIGERSEMTASGVAIDNAGTGAASKDGSLLTIHDSRISKAGFAAMTAYIKKPEYGPARMVADGVEVVDSDTPVIVQTGSELVVDGVGAPTRDVDVDALYETIMRPGLRK